VKNDKAEKRRKKLDHKRQWQAKMQQRAQYPDFVYDEKEGNPEFIKLVKDAVRRFDFTEVSLGEQKTFRDMNKRGFTAALMNLRARMWLALQKDPENQVEGCADLHWNLNLGEAVFRKIPEADLRKYLPVNDVCFRYIRQMIVVKFRSLLQVGRGEYAFYYSRRKPTVEVDGKRYVVAFSKHAIDRIGERISSRWLTYAGLGDLYSFFDECVFFETCTLHKNCLGFTFYDICGDKRFFKYQHVEKVLGIENLDPKKGEPYYRVGYCPADLIDGKFIKAKTLLFPGFSKTPEYGLLQRSRLTEEKKTQLRELATKSDADTLFETKDFSALKWFHDNGIPQVIQTTRRVYD